jgi:hypothetical protein
MALVVVLFESSTGSSIRKGLLRLAGTVAGAVAGMAILYFVVLCNGLSHSNNPQASLHRQTWLALQPCGKSGAPNTNNCPQLPTPGLLQKFILTALLLGVACGISGAAAARTPGHTYMQVRGRRWALLGANCGLHSYAGMQQAA